MAVVLASNGEMLRRETHHRMILCLDLLVALVKKHFHTAVDEYGAKHRQQPCELANQACQGEDEDESQHDGSEDAPEKYTVVVFFFDAETDENHYHHEDIVNRKALLQEIAREELLYHLAAIGRQVGLALGGWHHPVAEEIDQHRESHRQPHPDSGPYSRLLHLYHLVFLVEHKEVEHQHDDHKDHEHSEKQSIHIQ